MKIGVFIKNHFMSGLKPIFEAGTEDTEENIFYPQITQISW